MTDWQPIETAPRDGISILLAHDIFEYVVIGFWSETEDTEMWAGTGYDGAFPTHWMPLPAPPLTASPAPETLQRHKSGV